MESFVAWVALVLAVLDGIVLFLVMREVALLKLGVRGRSGLKFDSPLPTFVATTLDGQSISSAQLRQTLLLFVSPSCTPCRTLLDDLRRSAHDHLPPLTVAVSTLEPSEDDTRRDFVQSVDFVDPARVLVDRGRQVFGVLQVPVTPYVYAIAESGRIRGSGAPVSAAQLREMAQAIT